MIKYDDFLMVSICYLWETHFKYRYKLIVTGEKNISVQLKIKRQQGLIVCASDKIGPQHRSIWAFLVAQMVKNLSTVWDTWIWSLGWEDPLEEGMATHSSILAWRTPVTEEPPGL